MDRLYIGQGYDLYWTFNIKPPTVEDYINMVDYSMFQITILYVN
jgi:hypothetical protein